MRGMIDEQQGKGAVPRGRLIQTKNFGPPNTFKR